MWANILFPEIFLFCSCHCCWKRLSLEGQPVPSGTLADGTQVGERAGVPAGLSLLCAAIARKTSWLSSANVSRGGWASCQLWQSGPRTSWCSHKAHVVASPVAEDKPVSPSWSLFPLSLHWGKAGWLLGVCPGTGLHRDTEQWEECRVHLSGNWSKNPGFTWQNMFQSRG